MSTLSTAAAVLGAALVFVPLFKRLGFGSVLGYLAAGALLGPTGFDLFGHPEEVMHFAELGVVLLLFLIGLELEPSRLWAMRVQVFGVGTAQVVGTGAILAGVLALTGASAAAAILVGFGLALSSTAFAVQVMRERGELAHPHGRAGFAILLLQDLAVIPLLAMIPWFAPSADAEGSGLMAVAQALGAVGLVIGIGRTVLRHAFRIIARTGNRELSVALALFVVLGTAALMAAVGLSMALGAFIAGIVLANSEYRHELEANLAPFEGLLLGLFFMSVGMTADVRTAWDAPGLLLGATAGLVALKAAVLYGLGRGSGLCPPSAVKLAATLSQGGEFGFVLFTAAAQAGAIPGQLAYRALIVVTLSMIATPAMLAAADALARRLTEAQPDRPFDVSGYEENPVIVAGFGRYGQMVGRTMWMLHVPFTALEIDPNHLDFVRSFGNDVRYGDASRLELLHAAKADAAKVLVIAVDDVEASVAIARLAREHFPHLKVLARARNRPHALALTDAGVEDVRRETLASALETTTATLRALGVDAAEAQRIVDRFRDHDEETLRRQAAVWTDDAKVIETARESAVRLRQLFERDEVA